MNWFARTKKAEDAAAENVEMIAEKDLLDPALRQTLLEFKASVDAWSSAELSRPRTVRSVSAHRNRVLVGWGLAVALLAATVASGGYEYRQARAAQQAAEQRMEQERAAAEKARLQAQQEQEQDLFASVDSAIARQVPSAMEPLAMLEDSSDSNR